MNKSVRRDQILRRAKAVFARRGYHDASISDIIDEAGIARGTFYLYFTSKRKIFGTLLDALFRELDERIRPVELGPGRPAPLDQVRENLRRVLDLVVSDPETMQLILHEATAIDRQSRAVLTRFYEHARGMIERSLKHGIRMGIVRECDAGLVASCILGSIKEIVERVSRRSDARRDLGPVVEEILQFGLNGIRTK